MPAKKPAGKKTRRWRPTKKTKAALKKLAPKKSRVKVRLGGNLAPELLRKIRREKRVAIKDAKGKVVSSYSLLSKKYRGMRKDVIIQQTPVMKMIKKELMLGEFEDKYFDAKTGKRITKRNAAEYGWFIAKNIGFAKKK